MLWEGDGKEVWEGEGNSGMKREIGRKKFSREIKGDQRGREEEIWKFRDWVHISNGLDDLTYGSGHVLPIYFGPIHLRSKKIKNATSAFCLMTG